MTKSIIGFTLLVALAATPVAADSVARGSAGSIGGSVTMIKGSTQVIGASGQVVVESVRVAGDITSIVLRDVSSATLISLTLSAHTARESIWVAGKTLDHTATAAGTILSAAGKMVLFVPNEIGRRLSHNATY